MIIISHKGNLDKTTNFLNKAKNINYRYILERYGQEGVNALSSATPIDSGLTSQSWSYTIKQNKTNYTISWCNSNVVDGVPIVVLIQYGHATKNGGYVSGRDFINPAIKPIFDKIAEEAWKEITKL